MKIKAQGHSLTLVNGHSDSTFSNFFSLETARPIEAKFHMDPPLDGGTKVLSNGPGHMTKMAAMPIYHRVLTLTQCKMIFYESCHKFFMKASRIL